MPCLSDVILPNLSALLEEDCASCQHATAGGYGDFVLATVPTNVAAIAPARARKRRKNEASVSEIKHIRIDSSTVGDAGEQIETFMNKAKTPIASKARGRPKGTTQFRCSGAVVMKSRQSHLEKILKPHVNVTDILHHGTKINECDLVDELQLSVLEVSWGRMKALFSLVIMHTQPCRVSCRNYAVCRTRAHYVAFHTSRMRTWWAVTCVADGSIFLALGYAEHPLSASGIVNAVNITNGCAVPFGKRLFF